MTNFSNLMYQAQVLLFDMDGTLVDSTLVVERTWRRFAERHRLDVNAILAQSHGRRTIETVTLFATPTMNIEQEAAQLVAEEIADVEGIRPIAGAKKFLSTLPTDRWAVVTSAHRELAQRRLFAAGLPIPDVLITAEDVQQGKPAPDGYLAAASILSASPDECLVFEDAPAGLAAANAAGMRTLAVGRHIKTSHLPHEAWLLDFTQLECRIPTSKTEQIVLIL